VNARLAETAPDRTSRRDWFGLPSVAGHQSLLVSLVIDSLGDGLFVPFALIYFLHTTRLSLTSIGLSLTIAGLIALPSVLPAGAVLDRFPAPLVVIAANLVSAAGYAGYLVTGQAWQLVLCALLAAVGGRVYWTANLGLIGEGFGADRQRWFALQRALRNAGYGLGGILGALTITEGGTAGYRALAAVNALSYVIAAALVLRWSARQSAVRQEGLRARGAADDGARGVARGGYRAALTDWMFMLITGANLLFVLCMMAPSVLLALYVIRYLHEPAWLVGALLAVSTVIIGLGQTTLSRLVDRLKPTPMLRLTAAVWAAAFVLFWLVGAWPRAAVFAGLLTAMIVFTVAEMIQGPALNNLVVGMAPDQLRGRYLGVYQLSWGLGRAVAPAIFSWMFATSAALPWLALAAACAACAIGLGWLAPTVRR
jgi:MFS family permease